MMSSLETEQGLSLRLWFFAGVAAIVLHVGGAALAVANLRGDDGDDGLGAAGVEIAFEMASPKPADDDLPLGPDRGETQQSRKQAAQKAEAKETELPKDRPVDSADPDRIVTTSKSKAPREDEPKVSAAEASPAEESPAQHASSRQRFENVPEAEQARAPNAGIGKERKKLTAYWGRKISAYFELHKRYPAARNKSAKVTVGLVLNRRGNVVSVDVLRSSGDPALDEAAISMIRRSDPVPKPPAGLTDDEFNFSLDVNFHKRK